MCEHKRHKQEEYVFLKSSSGINLIKWADKTKVTHFLKVSVKLKKKQKNCRKSLYV